MWYRSWGQVSAAFSDERTGDGVRGAPPPPAHCPSSGAGSRGFEGGRSIPLARPRCSTSRGLALALGLTLATKGVPGRACGRLRTPAAAPSGAPGRLPVASTHRRRVSRRCGSPRSRALRSCCPSTTGIAWNGNNILDAPSRRRIGLGIIGFSVIGHYITEPSRMNRDPVLIVGIQDP